MEFLIQYFVQLPNNTKRSVAQFSEGGKQNVLLKPKFNSFPPQKNSFVLSGGLLHIVESLWLCLYGFAFLLGALTTKSTRSRLRPAGLPAPFCSDLLHLSESALSDSVRCGNKCAHSKSSLRTLWTLSFTSSPSTISVFIHPLCSSKTWLTLNKTFLLLRPIVLYCKSFGFISSASLCLPRRFVERRCERVVRRVGAHVLT